MVWGSMRWDDVQSALPHRTTLSNYGLRMVLGKSKSGPDKIQKEVSAHVYRTVSLTGEDWLGIGYRIWESAVTFTWVHCDCSQSICERYDVTFGYNVLTFCQLLTLRTGQPLTLPCFLFLLCVVVGLLVCFFPLLVSLFGSPGIVTDLYWSCVSSAFAARLLRRWMTSLL